jgi:hypothetical protein
VAVDNFVDNSPLTAPGASGHAGFNKLPIQKAKIKTNEINGLKNRRLSLKNYFSISFATTICA